MSGLASNGNPPDLRLITSEPVFDSVPSPENTVQVEEPVADTPTTSTAIATSPAPAPNSRAGLVIFGIVVVGLFMLARRQPVDVFHAVDLDEDEDDESDDEEEGDEEPAPADPVTVEKEN